MENEFTSAVKARARFTVSSLLPRFRPISPMEPEPNKSKPKEKPLVWSGDSYLVGDRGPWMKKLVSCDCSTVATRCGVGLMLDNLGTARLSLVQLSAFTRDIR